MSIGADPRGSLPIVAVTDTLWSAGQVEEQAWPYGSLLQEASA